MALKVIHPESANHQFDTCVIVPCYNEEQRLTPTAFADFAREHAEFHFRFVNDGSTDGTQAILDQLTNSHPAQLSSLKLVVNSGKAEAVRQGLLSAIDQGHERVAFWDADLATPLYELPRFRQELRENSNIECVIGIRNMDDKERVKRTFTRRFIGKSFAKVASFMLGENMRDTQCGAKMFEVTPRLQRSLAEPFSSRWIFDVELLYRLKASLPNGQSLREITAEIDLHEWTEIAGSTIKATDFARIPWDLLLIQRSMWQHDFQVPEVEPVIAKLPTKVAAQDDQKRVA